MHRNTQCPGHQEREADRPSGMGLCSCLGSHTLGTQSSAKARQVNRGAACSLNCKEFKGGQAHRAKHMGSDHVTRSLLCCQVWT